MPGLLDSSLSCAWDRESRKRLEMEVKIREGVLVPEGLADDDFAESLELSAPCI